MNGLMTFLKRMQIYSRAPVRIGFAGGGTDLSPYCDVHGGQIVNATINQYAWGTLSFRDDASIFINSLNYRQASTYPSLAALLEGEKRDIPHLIVRHFKDTLGERGFNFTLGSDVPPRSGLGSSASVFVAGIALFNHYAMHNAMTPYEIADLALHLERNELKNLGGKQDQYAASFGGFNFMEFKDRGQVLVSALRLPHQMFASLENRTLLAFTGGRAQMDVLTDQIERSKSGASKEALDQTKFFAGKARELLLKGRIDDFGRLLDAAWHEKKKFSALVSNSHIDVMYATAIANGAIGGKLCGAGGGGHMFFVCKEQSRYVVQEALEKVGARIVPFSFVTEGVVTWEH